MYIFPWLAIASFLRFLPSCTATPIAQTTNASTPATNQTASNNCSSPSTAGITSTCWTTLQMDDFFANWTINNIMPNPPMIGTLYCRPREVWAECFLRFAYGEQRLPIASTDCSTLTSTTCKSPAKSLTTTPTSPQFYYGAYAIFGMYPSLHHSKPRHHTKPPQPYPPTSPPSPPPSSPPPPNPAPCNPHTRPPTPTPALPRARTPSTPPSSSCSSSTGFQTTISSSPPT